MVPGEWRDSGNGAKQQRQPVGPVEPNTAVTKQSADHHGAVDEDSPPQDPGTVPTRMDELEDQEAKQQGNGDPMVAGRLDAAPFGKESPDRFKRVEHRPDVTDQSSKDRNRDPQHT